MPRIHLLPDHLVSQIAAGEVVERPASVVKELVENALDAGASEVRVELEAGGKRRIVVADDASGMGRDDALLAFDRHATSKIASFDDLQRVGTLGFRGEALASIAAVARVELTTAESAGEGHRVRIEGGRVRVAEPAARARGTTVEVASLFFNVPARRKFLKQPATELRRALEVVQGYALARPEVRFTVVHEGRTLLDALPAGGAAAGGESGGGERGGGDPDGGAGRERIAQLFDRAFAGLLVAIPPGRTASGETISGFVGPPATARGRRQFVFVNRRLLRDRAVTSTFFRAVRDEWRSEDFPALFLFLDLPAEEVDVNVHPQKSEVRFRDRGLFDRLYDRLRAALERARGEEPAPLREPAGRPATPLAWQGLGGRGGWGSLDRGSGAGVGGAGGGWPGAPGAEGGWEVREVAAEYGAPGSGFPSGPSGSPGRLAEAVYAPLRRPTVPLSGRSGEPRSFRLLGQYKGSLILLEGPDGLYLIDQHVAHERLLFERLRRALAAESTPSQSLLTPLLLELSAAEHLRLTELAPALETCGFSLAPLSGRSLALTAVPAVLSADEAEDLVRALAADEGDHEAGAEAVRLRILETLAADGACKAAVKMHHPLSAAEMEALVSELFEAENPYACPHGRPVVLEMTDADLEHRFGRR